MIMRVTAENCGEVWLNLLTTYAITMHLFKGPDLRVGTIIMIIVNAAFLPVAFSNPLVYFGTAIAANALYYFLYRDDMNYFKLTNDRVIVKNTWRRNFHREILFKDIKAVGTNAILYGGLHLEFANKENKALRFNCANVGFKRVTLLIEVLFKNIPDLKKL